MSKQFIESFIIFMYKLTVYLELKQLTKKNKENVYEKRGHEEKEKQT